MSSGNSRKGPERALIYPRVSSAAQEDGTSLASQEAAARAYCAARGYAVVGCYPEVEWAEALEERPRLTELRDLVRAGGADVVVGHALDRVARQSTHLAVLIYEFERHGARLELVTESFEDSAVGRFLRNAKAFAAEVEAEKIRERTSRGKLARLHQGKLPPMRKPTYGYRWADPARTRLEPDPVTSAVVRRIYAGLAAGATLRGLAATLTAGGVPSPWGTPRWRTGTLSKLVRHPAYGGRPAAGRQASTRPRGKYVPRPRPESEWVPLPPEAMPALVAPETWAAAQRQLAANRQQSPRNLHHPDRALLWGGLARCAACGAALQVGRSGGWAWPDGSPYVYYRCRHSLGPCALPAGIGAAVLDAAAWREVLTRAAARPPAPPKPAARPEGQRAALEREYRQTKRHLDRAVAGDVAAETETEAARYRREVKRLAGRERELAAQLAALADDRERDLEAWERASAAQREAMAALGRLWQLRQPADHAEMRAWVLKLGVRAVVHHRRDPAAPPGRVWFGQGE